MADQKYASWAAEDTRDASSLPSDFDATIVAAQFSREAPDNYQAEGDPIFGWITYLIDDAGDYKDKSEEERTLKQAYGLGGTAGKEFTISDDGYGLIPIDPDLSSAIRKGSKFDLWKCALENEGVSKSVTRAGSLEALIGVRGHMRRVDDEKLLGKKRDFSGKDEKDKKQSKFPPQTLVMVKLLGMPGEKGKPATTSAAAPSKTASAPAGAVEGDLDTQTVGYLLDVLASAKDNKVQRSQLVALLSKAAIKAANRQEVAKRGSDEAFLLAQVEAGIIEYDPAAKPQIVALKQ